MEWCVRGGEDYLGLRLRSRATSFLLFRFARHFAWLVQTKNKTISTFCAFRLLWSLFRFRSFRRSTSALWISVTSTPGRGLLGGIVFCFRFSITTTDTLHLVNCFRFVLPLRVRISYLCGQSRRRRVLPSTLPSYLRFRIIRRSRLLDR